MTHLTYSDNIKTFIVENFLYGEDKALDNGASLLDTGVVDSTGILEIITHVENQFGIKVNDDEILPENFDSIDRITAFIGMKTKAGQAV